MKDEKKTKKQLIEELRKLRRRLARCEELKSKGKRPEEAPLESERNFRALAENADDGILIATDKGRYIYANKRAARMTGYSVAELLKIGMKDLTHPDEVRKITERFRKRMMGRPVARQYETVVVRKDGKSVPIELTAAKTIWHGQPAGLAIIRDITERKKTEEALRESEERYQALFDRSLYCVFVHDFEGQFIDANQAALNLFGFKRKDIPHLNLASLLDENQLPKAMKILEEIRKKGFQKKPTIYKLKRKDGNYIWVETEASVIYRQGEPYAIQGIARDITENKWTEEILRESEERFRLAFEGGPLGMALVGLDFSLLKANRAFCKMLGYTESEISKLTFVDITHPEDIEKDTKLAEQVFKGAIKSYKLEKRYITKTQEILWANLTATVIRDQNGEALYGLAMIEDISEKKRAEEALRESELRYRTTIDSMSDIIHLVDEDLRIIMINPAFQKWAKLLNLETKVIGRTPFRVFPFLPDKIRDEYLSVFKTGKTLITEEWTEIEGQQFVTETRKIPIFEKDKVVRIVTVIRDFTQQRRAEESLRESEEQYRSLVEESLQGLVISQGFPPRLMFANSKMAEITGYTIDELRTLVPEEIVSLVHVEDQAAVTQRIRDLLAGESVSPSFELRIVRKDRIVRWVQTFTTNMLYRGEPVMQTAVLDITERKEAERKLREREEYHSHLIENLTDIIAVVEEDGTIRYISSSVKELYGLEPDDMIDTSLFEYLHPEDVSRVEAFYNKAIKNPGMTPPVEYRMHREDGSWAHLESVGNNLLDNPVVEGVIITSRDITERKQAERELRIKENAIASSINGIGITDLQGKLVYVNDSAVRMWGYDHEDEILGRPLPEFWEGEGILETVKALREKGARVGEDVGRRKDGSLFDVHFATSMIKDESGNPIYMFGSFLDITERKRDEEELRKHREHLEELVEERTAELHKINKQLKREIQERKQTEEALRESEERYRSFVQNFQGIAYRGDGKFTPIFFHGAVEDITGYTEEELTAGKPRWDQVIHPDDLPEVHKLAKDLLATPCSMVELEYRIVRKDGHVRWVREFTQNICHDSRKPVLVQGAIYDITERKQAEKAIQQSEQTTRALLNAPTDSAWVLLDSNGIVLAANEAAAERLDKNVDEFIGTFAFDHFLPDVAKYRRQKFDEVFRTGKIVRFEDERMGRILDTSIYPIRDAQGKVQQVAGFSRDITEHRRAEEALQVSEEKYRTLFETSPDGIVTATIDGAILEANKAFLDMLGYTLKELQNMHYQQLTPKKWHKAEAKAIESVLKSGHGTFEKEYKRKDGTIFPVSLSGWIIKDKQGIPEKLSVFARDITERKRMELTQRALQQISNAVHTTEDLNELFKAIHQELGAILNTENFFIALLDKDSDTISFPYHKDERDPYVEALPVGKTLTGYVIRKSQPLLATKSEIERLAQTDMIELLGVVPEIWLGVPMRVRNKKIGALVVQNYEDRSALDESDLYIVKFVSGQVGLSIERKRAEEQLKETLEELARSNAELEQFAHVASHDLQEPLQAVAMSIEIVAQRHRGKFDARADKFIKYAIDESNRMQMLVQDLLTYSRVGMGSMEFEPTDCHIILDQTLDNLIVPIEQSDAKITHGLLPTVMGDPLQLTQLFQNLIDNAIKFRREEPPHIHVSAKRKGDEWVFAVRDNGMGFDPKHNEKIFAAFERLLDKTEYLGTGIGLAICRKIVDRHGGRIWAESKPGEGATFYFTLPARKGTTG